MFTPQIPEFHEIEPDFTNRSSSPLNAQTFTNRLTAINYPLNKVPTLFLDNVHMKVMNKPVIYGKTLDHAIDRNTYRDLLNKNDNSEDILTTGQHETDPKCRLEKHNLETILALYMERFVASLEKIHKIEMKILDELDTFASFIDSDEIHAIASSQRNALIDAQKKQFEEGLSLIKLDLKSELELFIKETEEVVQFETDRKTKEKEQEFMEITAPEQLLLKVLSTELEILSEKINPPDPKKEPQNSLVRIALKFAGTPFNLAGYQSTSTFKTTISANELLTQKHHSMDAIDEVKRNTIK